MAGLLVVSCLILLAFLDARLIDSLKMTGKSNEAECNKLTTEADCGKAGACIWDSGACSKDPCYEKTYGPLDNCKTDVPGKTCKEINGETVSFCVTEERVASFSTTAAKCSLEWGETKYVVEGLCHSVTGCETVTPIEITGTTYYFCNEKPPPVDDCNVLTAEICPYIGKCKWEGDKCVNDSCWEKTYSSSDGCDSGCDKFTITGSGATELGYCKSAGKDLHDKCNGGTGTNALTKRFACTGYGSDCEKIVTINNYEGGTLYVCSTAEDEFTVPDSDAAVSLNSFAIAVSALILLVLSL